MTTADQKPSGVLVTGVIESDTHTVGQAIAAFGLTLLPKNGSLDDLASRVLAELGGSWESPPPTTPSEFAQVDRDLAETARHLLREAFVTARIPDDAPWVWADPRHSLLAPFWASALDVDFAIVHVHRDPLTAMEKIARELSVGPGQALALWERFNRAVLVSCARWTSIVLGRHALEAETERCVQALSDFADLTVGVPGRELESAVALVNAGFSEAETSTPGVAALEASVSSSHRILDEILSGLECVIVSGAQGDQSAASAYSHLPDLYDAEYYREHLGTIPYNRSEPHWIRYFGEVADSIVATIAPRTVLDAGCAIGLLVEALRARGVDASGVDVSAWAIAQVPEELRPYCRVGSITEALEGHYDLITCIEVLEHLPAFEADPVIQNLCAHADAVLFSSTPDDFEEPTHLNVESTAYWARLFAAHGFFRDIDHDAQYLAPQAILFRKSTPTVEALISGYESSLWNLRETLSANNRVLTEEWRTTASRVRELEVGLHEVSERWRRSASRVAELEEWLNASDERTVVALESYVDIEALRSMVAGPPVVGVPEDAGVFLSDDYSLWRASRAVPPAPATGPLFSVVVPVFNPQAEHLSACIRSVRAQTYGSWELVLVDVSTAPHVRPICERFEALDRRVRVLHRDNTGIAENTDLGVQASQGNWIVFLDHDDTLEEHALASVARYIESHQEADFVYSDEDKLDPQGSYVAPFFKPDWSPDLLRTVNYICHLVSVRRSLYDEVGGLRPGFDGAQDYDFVLRATAEARQVGHVADVLYHWRQHPGSTASDVGAKPEAHAAGRRALESFVRRHLPDSWIEPGPSLTTHRVRYPVRYEKVSIIIPFRDQPELTDACIRSIAGSAPVLPMEVLLVSNRSIQEGTFSSMQAWEDMFAWTRVLEYDEPFNFQKLNNWAARQATGTLLLFLNNDIEVMHAGWLEELAEQAQRPEVGAVGARLFYPDGLVQHAGVAVGIGGLADHPWAALHPDAWTPAGPSYWIRDFLAVTAACLMVDHGKFDRVSGFDERFGVCGGDVDLCLRLFEHGLWNVMTPFARLIHRESATRQKTPPDNDVKESLRAYAAYLDGRDPFFNPNLSRSDGSCRVATSPHPQTQEKRS